MPTSLSSVGHQPQVTGLGFNLYLVFITSWFLHLGSRIPPLGTIRFDLILVGILTTIVLARKTVQHGPKTETDKVLRILIMYSILTIPFVQWPGSVINRGIEQLIKAVVFYYFTVALVDTEKRLKTFILVFVACQLFRVMEPLFLHITQGYWGSYASMANWEYLDRLSGAPSDTINPNGLAFIVCTVLPFVYFLSGLHWINRLALLIFAPLCVYALVLTGSRSGFVGLFGIVLGIVLKSRRPAPTATVAILIAVLAFPFLSADMQDRYLSIVGMGAKNEGTASGRVEGVEENFSVALRRPFFGHGLGTSREANANFGGEDKPAHNLYAEVAQELGFIGMIIVIFLIKSIFTGFSKCKQLYLKCHASVYLLRIVDAMQIWLWLNILFSFASYGLTSYEWYLLAGFSVVLQRLAQQSAAASHVSAEPASTLPDTSESGVVHGATRGRTP